MAWVEARQFCTVWPELVEWQPYVGEVTFGCALESMGVGATLCKMTQASALAWLPQPVLRIRQAWAGHAAAGMCCALLPAFGGLLLLQLRRQDHQATLATDAPQPIDGMHTLHQALIGPADVPECQQAWPSRHQPSSQGHGRDPPVRSCSWKGEPLLPIRRMRPSLSCRGHRPWASGSSSMPMTALDPRWCKLPAGSEA